MIQKTDLLPKDQDDKWFDAVLLFVISVQWTLFRCRQSTRILEGRIQLLGHLIRRTAFRQAVEFVCEGNRSSSSICSVRRCYISWWWLSHGGGCILLAVDLDKLFTHDGRIYIYTYIYIYIYIVIPRQTVSFCQNSSVWLDKLDSRSWDRNLTDWNANPRFYHSATRKLAQANEI